MLMFSIDKNSGVPVYRQLVEEIARRIKSGELRPGDRLPPERELAAQLDIARGTVKRAYEKLAENHILDIGHGRGTFVSSHQDVVSGSGKDRAVALIRKLITDMLGMDFDYDEIRALFHVVLEDSRRKHESFHIAAVDCNPESLATFETQLRHITNLHIHKFPLDLFRNTPDAALQLQPFDVVLTTSTHYSEVCGLVPELRSRLLQVVLSPSQQTIIDLANLSHAEHVGVLTESRNFQGIIRSKLKDFLFDLPRTSCLLTKNLDTLAEFLRDKTVLIVLPAFVPEPGASGAALRSFTSRGGKIIRFEYQIERGALLYLEKIISERMAGRIAGLSMLS